MGVGRVLKRLRVLTTRQEIEPDRLAGSTVVVVDIFLATTTLLTILENGARRAFPVASLEEAEEAVGRLDPPLVLRGGEQNAKAIEGYDRGPYPEEYTPEVVAGKDVVFLTTNGTKAIAAAADASPLLVSCLRNAPATAEYLRESDPESVYIVCIGSMGRFTLEDFLGASLILSSLAEANALENYRLNDGAWAALDFAKRYRDRTDEVLSQSRAGRWLFANNRVETFRFVGDVGASGLVVEVTDGQLREIGEPKVGVREAESNSTPDSNTVPKEE